MLNIKKISLLSFICLSVSSFSYNSNAYFNFNVFSDQDLAKRILADVHVNVVQKYAKEEGSVVNIPYAICSTNTNGYSVTNSFPDHIKKNIHIQNDGRAYGTAPFACEYVFTNIFKISNIEEKYYPLFKYCISRMDVSYNQICGF